VHDWEESNLQLIRTCAPEVFGRRIVAAREDAARGRQNPAGFRPLKGANPLAEFIGGRCRHLAKL